VRALVRADEVEAALVNVARSHDVSASDEAVVRSDGPVLSKLAFEPESAVLGIGVAEALFDRQRGWKDWA